MENPQVKQVVENLSEGFESFKAQQDNRLAKLETAMARKNKGFIAGDTDDETRELKNWLLGKDFDRKALSVSNDGQGVTVREDWLDRIFMKIRESSPVRQVASAVSTESNEVEVLVDRGEPESNWVTETDARSPTTLDFLTRHKIAVNEHYAYPSATQQMLEDSQFDVEQWVQGKTAARFARQENFNFINGDGVGKPRGILDYARVPEADFTWGADPDLYEIGSVFTGVDGELAGTNPQDVLYDLVDALKADYLPNASFLLRRSMWNQIRKLKDNDGRSLLQVSLAEGAPDRMLGYPVRLAEDMPVLAADVPGILFGDFREAYTVVDRLGIGVLRDPYTQPGFVRWYVRKRVGGALTNPEAVKALVLGTEPV